jgi:hypothetical protein
MIRYTLILTLAILVFSSCGNRKKKKPINLTLFYTQQYCGGAAPDDEILEQYKMAKPYTDTVYLHQSPDRQDEGVTVRLNKQGKAKLEGVSEGTYFAFRFPKMNMENIKIDPTKPGDPLCEHNYQSREMIVLNIESYTTDLSDTLRFSCNPCDLEMPMMPPPVMEEQPIDEGNK